VAVLDNSLLIWIVMVGIALLVLRFIFKVTKKIITMAFMIGLAVAIYIFITQYVLPNAGLP
jgi:hypothetical protein